MREIPKFCEVCGSVLVWGERKPTGYDRMTGGKMFIQQLLCPMKRWFRVFHPEPHDGWGEFKRYFHRTVTVPR